MSLVRYQAVAFLFCCAIAAVSLAQEVDFTKRIEDDWIRQEQTFGRSIDSPEALEALCDRGERLASALSDEELISDEKLAALRGELDRARENQENLAPAERQKRYLALRWLMRDSAFANPLIQGIPVVFLKADRYVWQLIHEYLSYYYRHTNMVGGELLTLKNPGQSFETVSLSKGKFPRGVFSTPSLSFDAKTLYFAFADFSNVVPENAPKKTLQDIMDRGRDTEIDEYLAQSDGKYHLFKMDLATGQTEQLTDGPDDDFDPAELPDGDLVFISTRRGGFARCTGNYEPVETATLHKRHKSGEIKCLSWHETNEWNPSVLSDGRIVYSRWDYVDREAARFMNLWVTNPDGTGAQALFGNYTEKVVASLQPKEIPNSNKIMFLGSGHHIAVGGPIAILDPTRVKYDPKTSEETLDCLDVVTPDIPFPETPVPEAPKEFHYVSDHYYYSPYPLSEDFYFTAYSHDPNGGYLAHNTYGYKGTCGESFSTGKMGLYYRDRFGNLELMYEDPQISCRYPIQIKPRPVPNVIASKLPKEEPNDATLVLSNVYESLVPFPKDRPITELRVFQLLPHWPDYASNTPRLGHARAANGRVYLGSVPVEEDGSAHFKVPARKPLYFQAIDADGKAVHTMMSEVYLQPGENRGCIGCHEQIQTASKNVPVQGKALTRTASTLKPGPDGTAPMSYPRLIQPILDRSCVSCHDGTENAAKPNLSSTPAEMFTASYNGLEPYIRMHFWNEGTIARIASLPGEAAADMSPLTKIIDDENHGDKIELSDADRRTLYFWLDANSTFYGTADPDDMKRQLLGEAVPIPNVQ